MKTPKPIIYALAIIGFAYCVFALIVSSGLFGSCELQPVVKLLSPSAQLQAELFIERCKDRGAPMVSLGVRKMAAPDQLDSVELGVATSNDFKVTWLTDERLQVDYPSGFRLSQEPSSVNGVELRLVPQDGG